MNEKNNAIPPLPFTKKEMREDLETHLNALTESKQLAYIERLIDQLTASNTDFVAVLKTADVINEEGKLEARQIVLKYWPSLDSYVLEDYIGAGYQFSKEADLKKLLYAFNLTVNQDMVDIYNLFQNSASDDISPERESELHATIYAIHNNYIKTYLQVLTIEFVEALLDQLDNQKSEQARTN